MKTLYSCLLILTISATASWAQLRTGQAGGTQLLLNSYARSSGVNGCNVSNVSGIESSQSNVAGLALTRRTEVILARTQYLVGSGIGINTLGVSQALGKGGGGVVGLNLTAFSFGDIPITTIDSPDGGLGTYSPTFMNIGLSYARAMVPDRIFVGFTVKLITESIPNAGATGVAFDAGVQYRDRSDKIKIGVALRNIGPEMSYSGDGLSLRAQLGGASANFDNAVSTKTSAYQLPSQLLIGVSYDLRFGEVYISRIRKSKKDTATVDGSTGINPDESDTTKSGKKRKPIVKYEIRDHRITPMLTFVSNSFSNDQFGLGVEYSFRNILMVRASYLFEKDVYSSENTQNVHNGLSAGATFEMPFGKIDPDTKRRRSTIGIDYSFRMTYLYSGTHCIGLRFSL